MSNIIATPIRHGAGCRNIIHLPDLENGQTLRARHCTNNFSLCQRSYYCTLEHVDRSQSERLSHQQSPWSLDDMCLQRLLRCQSLPGMLVLISCPLPPYSSDSPKDDKLHKNTIKRLICS